MSSVLRMDLYRLRKSKSFYLILGIAVIMTVITVGLLILCQIAFRFAIEEAGMDDFFNSQMMSAMMSTIPTTYSAYMTTMLGSSSALFPIIFGLLFYHADYAGGYIKNTIIWGRKSGRLVLSRLIVLAIFTLITDFLIAVVVSVGCAMADMFSVAELIAQIKVFFAAFLMHLALASLMIMLFTISQKLVPALVTGICYCMAGNLLFSLLSMPIQFLTKNPDFTFARFTCLGNMDYFNKAELDAANFIRIYGIAIVVLGVSVALSIVNVKKRDIR